MRGKGKKAPVSQSLQIRWLLEAAKQVDDLKKLKNILLLIIGMIFSSVEFDWHFSNKTTSMTRAWYVTFAQIRIFQLIFEVRHHFDAPMINKSVIYCTYFRHIYFLLKYPMSILKHGASEEK